MPLYALFFFSGKGNMRNNIYSYLVSVRLGGGKVRRFWSCIKYEKSAQVFEKKNSVREN